MLGLLEQPTKIVSASYCPFPNRICEHWPIKNVHTQNPLAPMLKALIAAAECSLETTIDSVAVSAYDIGAIDLDLSRAHVHAALSELGVDDYNPLGHVARQLAPAVGIQGDCSGPFILPNDPAYYSDPVQNVFTIEYTRDSMTAGLWNEDCGVMEMAKRLNSAQLGHNAVQTCRESSSDIARCEEAFESALRSVIEDSHRAKHEEIDAVLVYGERADDNDMLVSLRKVLIEQFPNGGSVDLSRLQSFSPDPTFAGSRAMARAMWAAQASGHEDHPRQEL